MNKLKVTLLYALALFAMVSLNSCGSDEDKLPTNVIEDESGVNIDLEWTTGGTVLDAQSQADLDIFISKDGSDIDELSSESGSSFERTTITKLYADGTYTVVAYLYNSSKRADYTVTVNGVAVSKPSTFNSYFVAGASDVRANTVKITKVGNKYTIDDAN